MQFWKEKCAIHVVHEQLVIEQTTPEIEVLGDLGHKLRILTY